MFSWKNLSALGMILLLAVACKESPAAPKIAAVSTNAASTNFQTFQVKGVVKELKPDGKTVMIKHENIPDYMPAMTMDFEVRDTNELRGLQVGDAIAFRMTVSDTDGWIHHITKLNNVKPAELPSTPELRVTHEVEQLNVGDPLPEYHFTNQLGKAVSTAEFKGQPLVFTFFFTSCPFPLYCPLISNHFEEVQKKLLTQTNAPANWHLLSISFDTDVDSPTVLKKYAERFNYDPKHWSFVTGEWADITAIGQQVAERFARDPSGSISHNLRTVVVDSQGRIQKIFTNNDWTADDLIAEILKAAQAKP